MRHPADIGRELLQLHEKEQAERLERLTTTVGTEAQALQSYLQAVSSNLAPVVPPTVSVEEFARGSNDRDQAQAERRLALCAKCPAHGGACERHIDFAPGGDQPYWDAPKKMLLWKQCDRWPEYRLRRKLGAAGVKDRLIGARFATYEERTRELGDARYIAEQYIEVFNLDATPLNLMLYGPTGTGKSHLAVACMAALFVAKKIRGPFFAYAPDLIEAIRRAEFSEGDEDDDFAAETARDADLLVLDDLSAEQVGVWTRKKFTSLMNERWQSARPTIVTTNASKDELEVAFGAPFMSRLLPKDQYASAEMIAPDQRRAGGTSNG